MPEQMLTQDEYDRLANDIRLGLQPALDQAKEKLAVAYMPLARNIAKKYAGKLGDLAESASYFGLTMAINSWNPDKGALPSWIRLYCKSSLLRELDKKPQMKMTHEFASKNAMFNYYKNQGIDPQTKMKLTDEEVYQHERVPKVGYIEDSYEQVSELTNQESEETNLFAENLISSLSPINQLIIKARFGIGYEGYCHSYEEIAELIDTPVNEVIRREILILKELKATPSVSE